MTCISGPPWTPGNTALSSSFWCCAWQSTRPPRGPRSVLWVVVVTKSECGTGLGCSPAATRPAMWAMSVITSAPTSLATAAMRAKSMTRGYGAGADHDQLRLVLVRQPRDLVVVDALVSRRGRRRDDRVELAREVQRVAVRQMPAVRQVHAQHGVARLQQWRGTPPCWPARPSAAGRWRARRRTAPWRARWPATRRRRRPRSRRSSAGPG